MPSCVRGECDFHVNCHEYDPRTGDWMVILISTSDVAVQHEKYRLNSQMQQTTKWYHNNRMSTGWETPDTLHSFAPCLTKLTTVSSWLLIRRLNSSVILDQLIVSSVLKSAPTIHLQTGQPTNQHVHLTYHYAYSVGMSQHGGHPT